jgi:two-component system, NarL family, response regulator DegU
LESSKKIRVWLASSFILLRSGLRALLTDCPSLECIGESELDSDALARIVAAQPDVLILDVDAHTHTTNAILTQLTSKISATQVIALSATGDKQFVLHLLEHGVHGYISHAEATTELIRAIEAVAQGDVFLCPSASGALLSEYRKRACRHPQDGQASGHHSTSRNIHPKT